MPTKNVTDERIGKFKNKGKDPAVGREVKFARTTRVFITESPLGVLQKLREKRISVCVELRKAHKNESFLKRRNITLSSLPDEDALSPDYTSNEMVSSQPSEPVWLAPVEP